MTETSTDIQTIRAARKALDTAVRTHAAEYVTADYQRWTGLGSHGSFDPWTRELQSQVDQMLREGLNGLILNGTLDANVDHFASSAMRNAINTVISLGEQK